MIRQAEWDKMVWRFSQDHDPYRRAAPVFNARLLHRAVETNCRCSATLALARSGGRDKSGIYRAREAQKSSKRPERMQQRRAMIALAPRTDQRIPECLSRSPMTVRHPASTTPDPTKKSFLRNSA